jgi:hypothetical protein
MDTPVKKKPEKPGDSQRSSSPQQMQTSDNQSPSRSPRQENSLDQLLADPDLQESSLNLRFSGGEAAETNGSPTSDEDILGCSLEERSTEQPLEPRKETPPHRQQLARLPPTHEGHQAPTRTQAQAAQALFQDSNSTESEPLPATPTSPGLISTSPNPTTDLRHRIRKTKKNQPPPSSPSPPPQSDSLPSEDAPKPGDAVTNQGVDSSADTRATPWRIEVMFSPAIPAGTDHSLIVISLQLMIEWLQPGASFTKIDWVPRARGEIMHVELAAVDKDLFRLLVPHPTSLQPSKFTMPALKSHQFLLRNLDLVLSEQLARQSARTSEATQKTTKVWIKYDPQRQISHTPASVVALLRPYCTYVAEPEPLPLQLSRGEELSGVCSGTFKIEVRFKDGPLPKSLSDNQPNPTYYHHDTVACWWLCCYCHQGNTPCAPKYKGSDTNQLKWSCEVYKQLFPDSKQPNPKALSMDQLINRHKRQSNARSSQYDRDNRKNRKKSDRSNNSEDSSLKKSRHHSNRRNEKAAPSRSID